MVALQQILFPTDEPVMPEARQIGRKPSIQALQVALEGARHQWLLGERRIGKTSVAKAALARLRSGGAVALDVDLSSVRIKTAADLAGEIAGQAQAAGVGTPGQSRRQIASFAHRGGRQTKALAAVLQTLGFADQGEPLAAVGREFSLAPIAREDWLPGLRSRFDEAGIEIADRELDAIVTASDCHPRRTMQIASNVEAMVRPLPHQSAGTELVALAISDAEGDRAWD